MESKAIANRYKSANSSWTLRRYNPDKNTAKKRTLRRAPPEQQRNGGYGSNGAAAVEGGDADGSFWLATYVAAKDDVVRRHHRHRRRANDARDAAKAAPAALPAAASATPAVAARAAAAAAAAAAALSAGGAGPARLMPLRWIAPKQWPATEAHNWLCSACSKPVSWSEVDDLQCRFCNAVAHRACARADARGPGPWTCADCADELQTAQLNYLTERARAYRLAMTAKYQVTLASHVRGLVQRRRWNSLTHALVHMQALARTYVHRNAFQQYRLKMLRPVRLSVTKAVGLASADWDGLSDAYVVVTVLDHKGKQVWRFSTETIEESLNPEWDEDFIIPGVGGDMTIVLTVVDHDDMRHQCLGQAVLPLGGNLWRTGGSFALTLGTMKHVPKAPGGAEERLDGSLEATGALHVSLTTCVAAHCLCGHLLGPSIEDMERNKSSFANNSKVQQKRMWVALFERQLFVYRTFGEPKARLVVPLDQASVHVDDVNPENTIMNVHFAGDVYRFISKTLALSNRWRSALQLWYVPVDRRYTFASLRGMFGIENWRAQKRKKWKPRERESMREPAQAAG